MALNDIREVSVPLNLDKPRTLKFDLNAFATLEDTYGSMEKAFIAMQSGSMKAARTLLWVGLLHEDDTLTEQQVGKMVTLGNINDIMGKITNALSDAMPDGDTEDMPTAKLKTSAETLTQRLDMQKAKVSELEAAYKKSVEEKGADAAETQKLAKELDNARSKMEQTERALNMVNAEIAKNENGWYRLSQNLQGVGDKLQKIGKSVSDVGMKLTKSVTI